MTLANDRLPETRQNPDRILPETRVLAAAIIPFLVAAFLILYIWPDESGRLFAWAIGPRMSAMMLGATYLTGVFFFSTVIFANRWQQVKFGFIPVTAFATCMAIATIIHWDAFTHDHPAFWLWAVLYATTPFLVLAAWFRNGRAARTESSPEQAADVSLPEIARWLVGVVGTIGVAVSVLLFAAPGLMIDTWPWTVSELTTKVIAAQFVVFSFFALAAFLDPRWESIRLTARTQSLSPLLFLVAFIVSWDDFDTSNPLTWVFAFNVAVIFGVGVPGLYLLMTTKSRRSRSFV